MLSLVDQLPLQAEGCRHLVTLITNYGTQYVKPTKGSGGVMTDIGVALSQSCVSLHVWYFSRFDCQAMSDPSPPGGPPMLGSEQGDDADTRVSFVLRHGDTDERDVMGLLMRAMKKSATSQAQPTDAYTSCDAVIQVHWGPAAGDADGRAHAAGGAPDDYYNTRDALLHSGPRGDAEPQQQECYGADDAQTRDDAAQARDHSPDRDDSQATLHLMSPVPTYSAEINGESDDATDR